MYQKKASTKEEWFKRNGFSKVDDKYVTYVVTGGNTYEIKERLKQNDCVYNKLLGWHSPREFEIEGFVLVPIFAEDIYRWHPAITTMVETDEAVTFVKEALKPYRPQKEIKLESGMENSEWMGEVGDRIRKIPAKIVGKKEINSQYGTSTLYTFESGNSVLCWFTSTWKDVEIGDSVLLSGTVKSLNEYGQQKQTILTRCILQPIE